MTVKVDEVFEDYLESGFIIKLVKVKSNPSENVKEVNVGIEDFIQQFKLVDFG
ncbi:MAG: hypothetical protein ACI9SK_001375 [Zhongshania sp.]|jgi:hypothetical protein